MPRGQPSGGSIPPYVPYATFRNFSDGLHKSPPTEIDRRGMMGKLSGTQQTQLLSALKFLHLINENYQVSPLYLRFIRADSKEKQKVLKEILEGGYPLLFDSSSGFDLGAAAESTFIKKFSEMGVDGGMSRKCQTFFLRAAQEAGVPISPYIQSPKTRSKPGRATRRPRGGGKSKSEEPNGKEEVEKRRGEVETPQSFVEAVRSLLTLTESSDNWTQEQKAVFVQMAQESLKK
jgi:hypothetical protein